MRICFYRHSLLNRGGDKMIVAHANHLVQNGHEVYFFVNTINTLFRIDPKIKFQAMKFPGKCGTLLSVFFQKQLADVIIADLIVLADIIYLKNRSKIVYFAQDYDETYYKNLFSKMLIRLLYFVGLFVFNIPVIAVSDRLCSILTRNFKAKVEVAANGVDTSTFYPAPSKELISAKNKRKAILILSRNDRRKGLDVAVDVIRSLSRLWPEYFEIWTVGEHATGRFGATPHKDFGYVSEEKLRSLMSSADVFLYPTRHEGYGLMVAEAFACKCPVVTTVAIPFAEHKKNSMVSPIEDVASLSDNLYAVLQDAALRRTIIEGGFRYAEGNSQTAGIMQFEKILMNHISG